MTIPFTRRKLIASFGAAAITNGCSPRSFAATFRDDQRTVVLDWALAATALALGATVIGVPAIDYYREAVVQPEMPDSVHDVGLLFTPNFEMLDALKPDLIVIPPALSPAQSFLERISPVLTVDLSPDGTSSLAAARAGTLRFADALSLRSSALHLIEETNQAIEGAARNAEGWRSRPILIGSRLDDRHMMLYGPGSLFADVVDAMSLSNAIDKSGPFGGRATVGLERVAEHPEAILFLIDPDNNAGADQAPKASLFWQALPAVRENRVVRLAVVMENGGLPAAARLANLLSASLAERNR